MVELSGREGSGKSEFLLNVVARCVLPRRWRGREVGGKEVEVVWVSTDYKFDLLRLVAILEGELHRVRKETQFDPALDPIEPNNEKCVDQENAVISGEGHHDLILSCLSRVHVLYCKSTTELCVTLHSLRLTFLQARSNVCALVLDNVAEFYWMSRADAGSVQASEVRQTEWVSALQKLVEEHHLVVFAARPLLLGQNTHTWMGKAVLSEDRRTPDIVCRGKREGSRVFLINV